jgi:hypothetical protein
VAIAQTGSSNATGTTSVAVTSVGNAGDILIASIVAEDAATMTFSWGAGWNVIETGEVDTSVSGFCRAEIAWRLRAGGDPASWTITGTTPDNTVGVWSSYSGCNTTTPVVDSDITALTLASVSTQDTPTITTSKPYLWGVGVWGGFGFIANRTWSTYTDGFVERQDQFNATGNERVCAALADSNGWFNFTPGELVTATPSGSVSGSFGALVALQPPAESFRVVSTDAVHRASRW